MSLGMELSLGPGDFVLDGNPAPSSKRGRSPPPQLSAHFYCGQMAGCIKMPLGMEVGLITVDFVSDGDRVPPIFGPCLLWPNGWMDQGATWHEGRPHPMRLCVRWGPSPLPTKGVQIPPQFSTHFYCGQTVGYIKMPLGMELGLSPGDCVLDGNQAPHSPKGGGARGRSPGAEPSNFRPMSIVTKRLDGSRWQLAWR